MLDDAIKGEERRIAAIRAEQKNMRTTSHKVCAQYVELTAQADIVAITAGSASPDEESLRRRALNALAWLAGGKVTDTIDDSAWADWKVLREMPHHRGNPLDHMAVIADVARPVRIRAIVSAPYHLPVGLEPDAGVVGFRLNVSCYGHGTHAHIWLRTDDAADVLSMLGPLVNRAARVGAA